MKKSIIRKGVFETNSSSCHSLCICGAGTNMEQVTPDENGVITISPGEFGWYAPTAYDFATKASYILTAALGTRYSCFDETCIDKPELVEMLISVIKDYTGCKEVKIDRSSTYYYIDHQSYGVWAEATRSKENLTNFLFSKNSELEISNDNR